MSGCRNKIEAQEEAFNLEKRGKTETVFAQSYFIYMIIQAVYKIVFLDFSKAFAVIRLLWILKQYQNLKMKSKYFLSLQHRKRIMQANYHHTKIPDKTKIHNKLTVSKSLLQIPERI